MTSFLVAFLYLLICFAITTLVYSLMLLSCVIVVSVLIGILATFLKKILLFINLIHGSYALPLCPFLHYFYFIYFLLSTCQLCTWCGSFISLLESIMTVLLMHLLWYFNTFLLSPLRFLSNATGSSSYLYCLVIYYKAISDKWAILIFNSDKPMRGDAYHLPAHSLQWWHDLNLI